MAYSAFQSQQGQSGSSGTSGTSGGGGGGGGGSVSIDNNVNNYLLTATGGTGINGESNLQFDGSVMNLSGIGVGYNYLGTKIGLIGTGTVNLDLSYQLSEIYITGNITGITHSNARSSGILNQWMVTTIGNGTGYSLTWPTSYKWPGNIAPTITYENTKRDVYQFFSYDGALTTTGTIYSSVVLQNI